MERLAEHQEPVQETGGRTPTDAFVSWAVYELRGDACDPVAGSYLLEVGTHEGRVGTDGNAREAVRVGA